MYELYVVSPDQRDDALVLDFDACDEYSIGRDKACDFQFSNANKVCGKHLRVRSGSAHGFPSGVAIMDISSTCTSTGGGGGGGRGGGSFFTLINGGKVLRRRWINLLPGSIVTLGDENAFVLRNVRR